MFTGIIQGLATAAKIEKKPGLHSLTFKFPTGALAGVGRGASIALDGVCLTVTDFDDISASFDVMQETLSISTFALLKAGEQVNFERAAGAHAEVGGHVLSGHVDCTGTISKITTPANNYVLQFTVAKDWFRYIFSKGYIAINGTSLTITNANRETNTFEVWLIPETLRMTCFGKKRVEDSVNIEIERQTQVIVDTVTNFMKDNLQNLQRVNS